jgi:hypothetical protein
LFYGSNDAMVVEALIVLWQQFAEIDANKIY